MIRLIRWAITSLSLFVAALFGEEKQRPERS
jgi:hypothetical protein